MKVEIDVELPEHIAEAWEVVAVRKPVTGEYVLSSKTECVHVVCVLSARDEDNTPRIILRRKENPRDWWPTWITATQMTFHATDTIKFEDDCGCSFWFRYETSLIDLSWIPGHLKRSGQTIKNPWKGCA